METTNHLKWDINLPVTYWVKAAEFQCLADGVYLFWETIQSCP